MKKEFYESEFGKITRKRLMRILICGLLCLIYSIYLLIDAIILDAAIYQYILSGLTFIAAIVFIISRFTLEKKFIAEFSNESNSKSR